MNELLIRRRNLLLKTSETPPTPTPYLIDAPLSQATGLQNLVTGQNAAILATTSVEYDSNFGAYFFKPRIWADTAGEYRTTSGIAFPLQKSVLQNKITIEYDLYQTKLIVYTTFSRGMGVILADRSRTYYLGVGWSHEVDDIKDRWLTIKIEIHRDGATKVYIDGNLMRDRAEEGFGDWYDNAYLQFGMEPDGRSDYHCEGYLRNIKVYTE